MAAASASAGDGAAGPSTPEAPPAKRVRGVEGKFATVEPDDELELALGAVDGGDDADDDAAASPPSAPVLTDEMLAEEEALAATRAAEAAAAHAQQAASHKNLSKQTIHEKVQRLNKLLAQSIQYSVTAARARRAGCGGRETRARGGAVCGLERMCGVRSAWPVLAACVVLPPFCSTCECCAPPGWAACAH
jgi:hypothetical protein